LCGQNAITFNSTNTLIVGSDRESSYLVRNLKSCICSFQVLESELKCKIYETWKGGFNWLMFIMIFFEDGTFWVCNVLIVLYICLVMEVHLPLHKIELQDSHFFRSPINPHHHVHNVIQSHNNVMRDWHYYVEYSSYLY
jgi:hypothetical protein